MRKGRSLVSPPPPHHPPLIALVQISATDPVAILVSHCLRVNSCNSWAIIYSSLIAPAKDNFKLSQVVLVVVTKIDTLIDLGEDECLEGTTERSDGNRGRSPRKDNAGTMCLEGTTERSDGNRVRSARCGIVRPMCLEGSTPQDM